MIRVELVWPESLGAPNETVEMEHRPQLGELIEFALPGKIPARTFRVALVRHTVPRPVDSKRSSLQVWLGLPT